MKALEAAQRLQRIASNSSIGREDRKALQTAIEALSGNPCVVCVYSPPSAGIGKPCTGCPAVGAVDYK